MSEIDDYFKRASEETIPKMRNSRMVVSVLDGRVDPKLCLELGAAILLEKPLILYAVKQQWIPPKLRALADAIVEVDDPKSEDAKMKLKAAFERVLGKPKQ